VNIIYLIRFCLFASMLLMQLFFSVGFLLFFLSAQPPRYKTDKKDPEKQANPKA
jgi:hypothetical protein